MADRPKDIRLAIGSRQHSVNIRKQTLTRQVREVGVVVFDSRV
jgi:hypothetical protein